MNFFESILEVITRVWPANTRWYKAIITHEGIFHADEAMATAIVKKKVGWLPVFRRNPTPAEMQDSSIIKLDVGGIYDPSISAYDHHQRGGAGNRGDENKPYATAGLIWRAMGRGIVDASVAKRVDEILCTGIDATDCGKSKAEKGSPSLSQCISWLNPPAGATKEERNQAFKCAVSMCEAVLYGACDAATEFIAARKLVLDATTACNGRVLILDSYVPWDEHIVERTLQENLLYVVYPSERGGYMIQQVPTEPGSFSGRKPLPESWAGLRDSQLSALVNLPGCIFCHPGRFIAGHETKEGALELARIAVNS